MVHLLLLLLLLPLLVDCVLFVAGVLFAQVTTSSNESKQLDDEWWSVCDEWSFGYRGQVTTSTGGRFHCMSHFGGGKRRRRRDRVWCICASECVCCVCVCTSMWM